MIPLRLEYTPEGEDEEQTARISLDYGNCPNCFAREPWELVEAEVEVRSQQVTLYLTCSRCGEGGIVELERLYT